MTSSQKIITQTKNWINTVVIGCNFCPFAAKVVKAKTVNYKVEESMLPSVCLDAFLTELLFLDNNPKIETSFLIFANSLKNFDEYLKFVLKAESLLKKKKYTGIYQLASFHPNYLFANSKDDDAENYTNRSIYPMLHLLRESSIDKAVEFYNDTHSIPKNNIAFAKQKGLVYMKVLRDSCITS
jgi:uncharacterized protein